MDASALPLYPWHGTARVAASVAQIPVVAGAYYAIDIDDTLMLGGRSAAYVCAPENLPRFAQDALPGACAWAHRVAACARLEYVTSRSQDIAEATVRQLAAAGFPAAPVACVVDKGTYVASATYGGEVIVFADDMEYNIKDVLKACPHSHCFLISKRDYEKYEARVRARDEVADWSAQDTD